MMSFYNSAHLIFKEGRMRDSIVGRMRDSIVG